MQNVLNGGIASAANGILTMLAASSKEEVRAAGAALGKLAGNYIAATDTPIDDTLASGFGLPFVDGIREGIADGLDPEQKIATAFGGAGRVARS